MKKLYGNFKGLKANQIQRLENFYRRRSDPDMLLGRELAKDLGRLSREIRRQVGLLINRRGKVAYVLIGDQQQIFIPDSEKLMVASNRLMGLRCIHTHLQNEPLSNDDLTDLILMRLDLMAAITINREGLPENIYYSHILPENKSGKAYRILEPLHLNQLNIGCKELIQALEDELVSRFRSSSAVSFGQERALLVSVTTTSKKEAYESLAELAELARTCKLKVVDKVLQRRSKTSSRFLIGRGKLNDLAILAMQRNASMLIFDQELNPSQIRSITDKIAIKVIDRTQLILDIFAGRAQSLEGKLQVELAQLKYLLPRLVIKNTAMSRLTGGIGGRGPGETKLEINRRRARQRIGYLEKALSKVKKQRKQQRHRRSQNELPIISIIGYTNAGKSTLLNTLTQSKVLAENKLFATLDPASRRLRFPHDMEVIITDTVGFIRDLPKELMVAFRATLEELENADLLLHIIDISHPHHQKQINAVEKVLSRLNLEHLPVIRVLNKVDLVSPSTAKILCRRLKGISICAKNQRTFTELIPAMINTISPAPEIRNIGKA